MVRILTGISVGGTFPLVFSLVGDLFFPHQRAGVAAGIQLATGAGFAAGQFIAGFVGEPRVLCIAASGCMLQGPSMLRGMCNVWVTSLPVGVATSAPAVGW